MVAVLAGDRKALVGTVNCLASVIASFPDSPIFFCSLPTVPKCVSKV